ncbi:MAG TPA: bifunctional DNA-formamidopyrimidine glycosylase/DNA-(apurinic or apyrimidinic site) lyase [Candidatus Atribacteria bacterium]|nr:bifunctional DNA-formamidopyrimidine glycosylase/DNA-(apurinic or apyrimidinic site) lyase [Candidatus Atribacteria bacterium]
MPELPEVEVIRRELREKVKGSRILLVRVEEPQFYLPAEMVLGKKIKELERKGKNLFLVLEDENSILFHLGMTGRLIFSPQEESFSYLRLLLGLSSGFLSLTDQRKLGKVAFLYQKEREELLHQLGIDPLSSEYTEENFEKALAGRKMRIKDFLLSQRYISGIGNIYASEILFRSSIHPARKVNDLTPQEKGNLFIAIPQVLEEAIAHQGTTIRDYVRSGGEKGEFQNSLLVYGKEGEKCPYCGKEIVREKIASRSTYFCPHCQAN